MTTTNFKTGPVDPKLPMELDDGTPVELVKILSDRVMVRLPATSNHRRVALGAGGQCWDYELATGLWAYGDAETFYVLRNVAPGIDHNGGPPLDDSRSVSLPEDPAIRAEYPLFDGFMAYFPNAMAEVARLSYRATQQHHPEKGMHWDRSKSTDHLNKIGRHMIDAGKIDDNGIRHSVMLAWRAMANLQEELERANGLPPSPASRNRPF